MASVASVDSAQLTFERITDKDDAWEIMSNTRNEWERFCTENQTDRYYFQDSLEALRNFQAYGYLICDEPYHFFVCRQAEKLEGMALIKIVGGVLGISGLMTHPKNVRDEENPIPVEERVRGVGTGLMKEIEAFGIVNEVKKIGLDPLYNARSFYEKLGFRESGDFLVKDIVD